MSFYNYSCKINELFADYQEIAQEKNEDLILLVFFVFKPNNVNLSKSLRFYRLYLYLCKRNE